MSSENVISLKGSELATKHSDKIKDKVILITGASPGSLGAAFVENLTPHQPALLIIAGRNEAKNKQTIDQLQQKYPGTKGRSLTLDLLSLAVVRKAAEEVNSWNDVPQIDILVNSAGIMATNWSMSIDGFESQLAVNHLAHFLFTNLIMNKILKSPAPRVVSVSSDGHRLSPIRFYDYNFHDGETYDKWLAYDQSKTANSLMAISLAQKLGQRSNLSYFSLHPGVILTNLASDLDLEADFELLRALDKVQGHPQGWAESYHFSTPDEGSATYVYAAFDTEVTKNNGAFLTECRVADPWKGDTILSFATSHVDAERLWKLSEKLVGQEFSY
ncbi:Short-chain dehydrogenase/reductase prx1 [Cladobotryum mycophilum]|uniref:Short-chain dehydrogenase/reductase prx1 n=1 Tax=Cladobotryum mycophilum TaxID=491253 RepID=A0ABR0SZG4_9HYPO